MKCPFSLLGRFIDSVVMCFGLSFSAGLCPSLVLFPPFRPPIKRNSTLVVWYFCQCIYYLPICRRSSSFVFIVRSSVTFSIQPMTTPFIHSFIRSWLLSFSDTQPTNLARERKTNQPTPSVSSSPFFNYYFYFCKIRTQIHPLKCFEPPQMLLVTLNRWI